MTSPVFQALVNARQQQLNRDEAMIADEVNARLGSKPADTHRPVWFIRWCEEQSLPWRPATPAVIAKYILSHTKANGLVEELRTLSLAHTTRGIPDPTSAWPVGEALSRLVDVKAPRSWPKEKQLMFSALPADIQAYISSRETERDTVLRRSQNDAALWRKHIETEKLKENDGTTEKPDETRADT